MSRHGKNCQRKARKNGRLKKWWAKHYGRPYNGRRVAPPASRIRFKIQENYELYGNSRRKG